MANTVKLKRSSTTSSTPASGDLSYGELAINYADGKLFYKNSSDVISEIGGALDVIGDVGDVTLSSVGNNEFLAYDSASSKWINQTALEAGVSSTGHTHTESDITDLGSYETAFSKNTAFNKAFGTATGTVTAGDDSRLSDSRTPTSHTHGTGDITNLSGTNTGDQTTVSGNAGTVTNGVYTTTVQGLITNNAAVLANTAKDTDTGLPAMLSNGTVPSLNSGISAAEVRSLIGAGTSSSTGTVTSVGTTGTVSGLTLTGTVTTSGILTLGGTLSLTSANVTGGLGFTPYNATNPSGYTDDQTAAEILTAIQTVDGAGSGLDADTLDGLQASSFLRSDTSDVYDGRVLEFGNAGNGQNTAGAFLTIEGNTDSNGEGSGRLFFREHNSTTSSADNYGMSLGYRGGATSVTTAMGNSWTGLAALGNGEWGMWGHDNSATGSLIAHGPRSGAYTDFTGLKVGGNAVWHAGNDGTGSGLDADLLDGEEGSSYLLKSGGAMTGAITTNSTFDGRDVATDGSKLDGIEASADVTDTTNVVAALTAGTNVTIAGDGTISSTDTNTNTTYTAGTGITLSGTEFSASPLALTSVQTATNQATHLALTAQEGDIVVRSDENKTYCHNGGSAGTMADYTLLATPTDTVLSVNGDTGAVSVTHDGLSDFVANEHIDWTSDQGDTNIHSGNYTDTNTTYTSSDFTHNSLSGVTANEHIDWTTDQGDTNLHAGNYTDTDTVYTHPTNYAGDDFSIDTDALSGATVVSDIDINVTTDTSGHVTDANGSVSTRTLTASDIGAASTSHTHSYLPLTGGTLSGNLTVNGGTTGVTLNLGRQSGSPNIKSTSEQNGYLIMDSNGSGTGKCALNWYSSDDIIIGKGGGNVGIGETSPGAKLHIRTAGANASDNKALILQNYASTPYSGSVYQSFKIGTLDMAQIRCHRVASSDGQLSFSTYNGTMSEQMRIDKDGNVGIGTTSPSAPLNVETTTAGTQTMISISSDEGMTAVPGTNNLFGIAFEDSGGTNHVGHIGLAYDGTTTNMHFGGLYHSGYNAWTDQLMTIKGNGNVGIGTSSPSEKLEVSGAIKSISTGAAHLILNGDSNNSGDTGQADSIIDFLGDGSPGLYGYRINTENWSGQTALHFQEYINGSYTSRLFINKTGNVGIGTTGPLSKFEVYGGSSGVNDVDRYVRFKAANGEKRFDFHIGGTGNASSLDMYQANGTTKGIRLSSTSDSYVLNNFGIGTNSPSEKLEVDGNLAVSGTLLDTVSKYSWHRYRSSHVSYSNSSALDFNSYTHLGSSVSWGSGSITVDVAGVYLVSAAVSRYYNTATTMDFSLYKNGTLVKGTRIFLQGTGPTYAGQTFAVPVRVSAGDTLSIEGTGYIYGSTSGPMTYFSGTRIGGL